MVTHKTILITIVMLSFLSSCITYYIPVDSLKTQFSDIDSTQLILVSTQGPAGDIVKYLANPIVQIKCIDKSGNQVEILNSPSVETRITTNDGKRTVFYFDRVFLQNDTLKGFQSRFLGFPKSIPVKTITKVEVQNGHKNFRYVEKKN